MKADSRTALRVIAVANLIFCAVGLFFAIPIYWQEYRILRDWPGTQAGVVQSEVVPLETKSGQKLYALFVEFSYQVNGRNFLGHITTPHQSTSFERKKKQAARFVPGTQQWIRYNPDNPADIRAEVGYNVHYFAVPIFITGVAALFGVLALIFFLLARAGRSREPAQAQLAADER
jgi:hypothetical protein